MRYKSRLIDQDIHVERRYTTLALKLKRHSCEQYLDSGGLFPVVLLTLNDIRHVGAGRLGTLGAQGEGRLGLPLPQVILADDELLRQLGDRGDA